MASNDINTSEDTEMNDECDGDKVVTMMDVLQEQQDFEEDANAVLGASDDKNCTYSKGYVKRQALYACLTCCSESKFDPTLRAGVCLACSLNCHENHELIELYTKRNFCCDCGNSKFNSNPCQFTSDKTDLNEENVYNQNFSGLYCTCHRPYPDPDGFEDEMIQCIICEDWLHAQHLEATVPSQDQYAEMVCKDCMDKNEFLHDYSEIAVNNEGDILDVVNNSINEVSMNGCKIEIKVNGYEEGKEHENKDNTEQKGDSVSNDIDMNDEATVEPELASENATSKMNDHLVEAINEKTNDEKETLETEQDPPMESEAEIDEENTLTAHNQKPDIATSDKSNKDTDIPQNESKGDAVNDVIDDIDKFLAGDDDVESKKVEDEPKPEQQDDSSLINEQTDIQEAKIENTNMNEEKSAEEEQNKEYESKEEKLSETTADIDDNKDAENITNGDINTDHNAINDTQVKKQGDNFETDDKPEIIGTENQDSVEDSTQLKEQGDNKQEDSVEDGTQLKEQGDNFETDDKQEVIGTEKQDSVEEGTQVTEQGDNLEIDNKQEVIGTENQNNVEEDDTLVKEQGDNLETDHKQEVIANERQDSIEKELGSTIEQENTEATKQENTEALEPETNENQPTPIDQTEDNEQMKNESSGSGLITNGHTEPNEHKRKLSTENSEDNEITMKKSKFDLCTRPKSKKKIFKGATFWPHNFRQKLCTCSECMTMYKDLSVLFLTDLEDTVTAYETLGKENGATTQYEKGMEALSSLDRIQQINALTEYNKMRDKLVDFLRSFKDRREVVKEEDIKAFFAGMKPTREPDGVYFCR